MRKFIAWCEKPYFYPITMLAVCISSGIVMQGKWLLGIVCYFATFSLFGIIKFMFIGKEKEGIDVGTAFASRLVNRDHSRGDGKHTAIEFRKQFFLDSLVVALVGGWLENWKPIVLDFKNVTNISPSFASEAFGPIAAHIDYETFLTKVAFVNISLVQQLIIKEEFEEAYFSFKVLETKKALQQVLTSNKEN